jgi:hypothetical protein
MDSIMIFLLGYTLGTHIAFLAFVKMSSAKSNKSNICKQWRNSNTACNGQIQGIACTFGDSIPTEDSAIWPLSAKRHRSKQRSQHF